MREAVRVELRTQAHRVMPPEPRDVHAQHHVTRPCPAVEDERRVRRFEPGAAAWRAGDRPVPAQLRHVEIAVEVAVAETPAQQQRAADRLAVVERE